ncbi:DUF2937 family protein [Celerinatantimonas yamalensis]|uniref:DUF2937 family protein n=1 Tax=Celerinatantimonas yamalensis TaxID=559956 RepID=A0ABW9GAP4_9GAMM
MRFLYGIVDRLLFIAMFIFAMQLPQFISLYQQRVEGFLQANQALLGQFQQMANDEKLSSLTELTTQLRQSQQSISRKTATLISNTQATHESLRATVSALNQPFLYQQVWALIRYPQPQLMWATAEHFQLGIALSSSALLCGLISALFLMMIKNLLMQLFHRKRRLFNANPLR